MAGWTENEGAVVAARAAGGGAEWAYRHVRPFLGAGGGGELGAVGAGLIGTGGLPGTTPLDGPRFLSLGRWDCT